MFPSVPGMDEVFGSIKNRGDRMKRAESRVWMPKTFSTP